MIDSAAGLNRHGGFRQSFDRVAHFEIILAVSILRKPPGSDAMNSITADKWIVQTLGDLMAQRRDIFESRAEQARTDPARVVEHITLLAKSVAGIARLVVI